MPLASASFLSGQRRRADYDVDAPVDFWLAFLRTRPSHGPAAGTPSRVFGGGAHAVQAQADSRVAGAMVERADLGG